MNSINLRIIGLLQKSTSGFSCSAETPPKRDRMRRARDDNPPHHWQQRSGDHAAMSNGICRNIERDYLQRITAIGLAAGTPTGANPVRHPEFEKGFS